MKQKEIKWLPEPEEKDYPAAASYLNLIFDDTTVKEMELKLKKVNMTTFKAKDVLRASSLTLLGISNAHVTADIKKIKSKKLLSPILLVRNTANGKLIIADGYHRLCAVYAVDEDAIIPCKII